MSAPTKGIFVSTVSRNKINSKKRDYYRNIPQEPWYRYYKSVWNSLNRKLKTLSEEISMKFVDDIIQFMGEYKYTEESIPAVALYTGTNLSDHVNLFSVISAEIQKTLYSRVVLLDPSQEISAKYLLGCMICSFITGKDANSVLEELQLEDENLSSKKSIKKLAYTMSHLSEWYEESFCMESTKSERPNLVVVIPDIESFSAPILRQFLKTLSVYKNRLPLMLVFGVATSFHDIPDKLSFEVLSKYTLHVFQSQSPLVFLNNVLEKVFLNFNCPFQLGNKVFEFLTTMFLYYNFSVEAFTRGIQFCLMNHFFDSDISVLCCGFEKISERVKSLTKFQLEEISQLPSVLNYKRRNSIDGKHILKHQDIKKLLVELHEHLSAFHVAVRCLHAISNTLPHAPLGTHIREFYIMSVSSDVTKSVEFRKCFDLLQHLSKDILLEKINTLISILSSCESVEQLADVPQKFRNFRDNIEQSDLFKLVETPASSPSAVVSPTTKLKVNKATPSGRGEFLQNLQNRSQPKKLTEFEKAKRDFLSFLSGDFFKHFLKPSSEFPLSEILIYNQVEVLRNGFDGIPLAVLHKAMCDPYHYLQCNCCKTKDNSEILSSFPDLCIAYKLHLECGTEVNLYDWLQTFIYKINENEDGMESDSVDPRVHARFLQVVKDLQFLGFIAPSRRKVDHVKKLRF